MLARIATFDRLSDDLDDDAVDLLRRTVKKVPGYVAGFHMVDPKTRKALSIAVFEDREALQRVGEALKARPEERKVGIAPDRVELFEAYEF
jgi:hypothetical protein